MINTWHTYRTAVVCYVLVGITIYVCRQEVAAVKSWRAVNFAEVLVRLCISPSIWRVCLWLDDQARRAFYFLTKRLETSVVNS